MKELHNLITNTTSLVGYIAVLMFAWAYLGGERSFVLDSALLKGNPGEYTSSGPGREIQSSNKPVIITIGGRQYEAKMMGEVLNRPEFTY